MKIQFYKAFTLIELLVVAAIIGILATAGVVAFNGYTESAKKKLQLLIIQLFIELCLMKLENVKLMAQEDY